MKVYLVKCEIDYEGCYPIGVYSTMEIAELVAEKHKRSGDGINIIECTVDEDIDT